MELDLFFTITAGLLVKFMRKNNSQNQAMFEAESNSIQVNVLNTEMGTVDGTCE